MAKRLGSSGNLVDEHRVAAQVVTGHDHLLSGDCASPLDGAVDGMAGTLVARSDRSLLLIRLDVHLIASLDQPTANAHNPKPGGRAKTGVGEG